MSPEDEGTDKPTDKTDTPELEGYAKYRHLKANVRKRRAAYIWIVVLALVAIVAAVVHIAFLMENPPSATDDIIMYVIYGLLAVLFLWALFMLFSGKRDVVEEAVVPKDMERTLLQCPECKATFQFGEQHFTDNKRTAFSCPVCGAFGKLPDPYTEPVKVLRPEGDFKELHYHCTNCNEDLAIGTFGDTPLHLVRFRACPNCNQKGHIERIQSEPTAWTGAEGEFAA